MMKKYLIFAVFSGAISVALGAFGAHGLKEVLVPEKLNSFLTGVRYQMIHSLFLMIMILIPVISKKVKKTLAFILVMGVLCFSGSIYLLSLNLVDSKYIWFVTPLGGLLMLVAWLGLAFSLLKVKSSNFQ